jgi:hypothetical protein
MRFRRGYSCRRADHVHLRTPQRRRLNPTVFFPPTPGTSSALSSNQSGHP